MAWMATLSGLKTLVGDDVKPILLFAVPLVVAAPFTLLWDDRNQLDMKLFWIVYEIKNANV